MIGANYTYWPCVPMTEYSYDTNELRVCNKTLIQYTHVHESLNITIHDV